MQAHRSEFGSATPDKEVPLLVALKGPVGGSLAFTPFPALGQNPMEQARGSVCLSLGGHWLRRRDLGPPRSDRALILALAPVQPHSPSCSSSSSSFAPPSERLQNVSTGGQRGNNKHKGPVYSSWPKFHCQQTRQAQSLPVASVWCVYVYMSVSKVQWQAVKNKCPLLSNKPQKTYSTPSNILFWNTDSIVLTKSSFIFDYLWWVIP